MEPLYLRLENFIELENLVQNVDHLLKDGKVQQGLFHYVKAVLMVDTTALEHFVQLTLAGIFMPMTATKCFESDPGTLLIKENFFSIGIT